MLFTPTYQGVNYCPSTFDNFFPTHCSNKPSKRVKYLILEKVAQWYSNVEISRFYLGNFCSAVALSLFSVCSSRLSFVTCAYLSNCLDFVYFYNWVITLYAKDFNESATIAKYSLANSLQIGKSVFYYLKKLSEHVFFLSLFSTGNERKKLVLRFIFVNLSLRQNIIFEGAIFPYKISHA